MEEVTLLKRAEKLWLSISCKLKGISPEENVLCKTYKIKIGK